MQHESMRSQWLTPDELEILNSIYISVAPLSIEEQIEDECNMTKVRAMSEDELMCIVR